MPVDKETEQEKIMEKVLPKVKCKLVGQDGNAWSIMGRFQAAARKAGWNKEDIDLLMKDAMSGDYNHLLGVIMEHCQNP